MLAVIMEPGLEAIFALPLLVTILSGLPAMIAENCG